MFIILLFRIELFFVQLIKPRDQENFVLHDFFKTSIYQILVLTTDKKNANRCFELDVLLGSFKEPCFIVDLDTMLLGKIFQKVTQKSNAKGNAIKFYKKVSQKSDPGVNPIKLFWPKLHQN